MGRSPLLRLQDMLQQIEAALRDVEDLNETELGADEILYAACQFRILVIAEAAKDLPPHYRDLHPEIIWSGLIRMGDLLRHQYFRIESQVVWHAIVHDFPRLLAAVQSLIKLERAQLTPAD